MWLGCEVPDDAMRSPKKVLVLEIFDGRELDTNNALGGFHHPLQGLPVGRRAPIVPDCGTVGHNALESAAVKIYQDVGG